MARSFPLIPRFPNFNGTQKLRLREFHAQVFAIFFGSLLRKLAQRSFGVNEVFAFYSEGSSDLRRRIFFTRLRMLWRSSRISSALLLISSPIVKSR